MNVVKVTNTHSTTLPGSLMVKLWRRNGERLWQENLIGMSKI